MTATTSLSDMMFLSDAEVERLTGAKQPAAQERILAEMGLRAHRNNLNRVIVARDALIRWQLGERPQAVKREPALRARHA